MDTFLNLINWFAAHGESVVQAVLTAAAIVRLTAWGQAHANALEAVTSAVEKANAPEVKKTIAEISKTLQPSAQVALDQAVATADPKKATPGFWSKLTFGIFGALKK